MILALEFQKLKRTGYLPAFFGGALLSAAVPIVNMVVRADTFTGLPGSPFRILMDANWSLMAQLTILLAVCGCSLMYNTEYADRGALKMNTLPVPPSGLFLGKFAVTLISVLLVLAAQTLSLALCILHWWPEASFDLTELLTGMGYELVLLFPTLALTLFLASVCQNLWISLGAGVILTFFGSMLRTEHELLALLPFAAPYRMLSSVSGGDLAVHLAVCGAQTVLCFLLELIYLHYRRTFA